MRSLLVFCTLVIFLGGCPKKANNVVLEGWHGEEDWKGQCYYHKNFAILGRGDIYDARQNSMEAMMSQWRGERNDGVQFEEQKVIDLETTMLGKIDLVDVIAGQNQKHCIEHYSGTADSQAWGLWFRGINHLLTENDCKTQPLNYTLFDYLDVGIGWQIPAPVCQGDLVRISGSTIDYYKVSDDSPWINVGGDIGNRAMGDEYPCTLEECFVGALIVRFTDDVGNETILSVGEELLFKAPVHGKIEVQINDATYYDNVYKQEGSLIHHTSIEYKGEG